MAMLAYNGTNWDTVLGTNSMGASNISLSTSYQAGVAQTAPNTTNKITGVVFYVASIQTLGDTQIEIRESGVSKVSGIALKDDLKLGYNYLRFTTPYQFTTTAAGAYRPYIQNTTNSSGTVSRDGSGAVPLLAMTYDSASSIGATDDVFILGHHNSGLTTQTLTLTGTSNSWGSGQNKSLTSNQNRQWGHATTIGNGGTLKFDTTASTKLTQYGSIFVMQGGLYDQRASSDITKINTLSFTNDADGDFNIMIASGLYGGQVLTGGQSVSVAATYNGGLGTAASPATFTSAHGFQVGDELFIGWGASYTQNENRFVISIPSATEVVWSSTKGGAETALVYTHATGWPVVNTTRNSVITSTDPTKGFSCYQSGGYDTTSDYSWTRFEYANCMSGRGLQLSSLYSATNIDGIVCYSNSLAGRISLSWGGSIEQTTNDVIMINPKGSNFSAQSGFTFAGASNKTLNRLYHFAEPASTSCCGGISVAATSIGNAVNGMWSSGGQTTTNSTFSYALGVFGTGNTFDEIHIDGSRYQAVRLDSGQENEFTNSLFGTVMDNTVDIQCNSGAYIKANFIDCSFGSTTKIDNYLLTLSGSDIGFQNMDGNQNKHRWYSNNASFWSAGAGLTNTTVRTAGSLSLAIKPEDATVGTRNFILKIPAPPESRVGVYGYIYRNATFSSGDIVVDFFLPGTLLTDTPDDTYTMPTTTEEWLLFSVGAYNPSTVARYARVRITAKTATAGATAFLDDLYDAGTNNKVAGLDLWDNGHISPIMVVTDFSSAVPVLANAVWTDEVDYLPGTKGANSDAVLSNTDATQAKVDLL